MKVLWIAQRGLDPNALIGDIANLVMGLISGTFTQSLTCPLKTVAIRIGSGVTGDKTMAQAARNIYKEGGIGGFFAGNLEMWQTLKKAAYAARAAKKGAHGFWESSLGEGLMMAG